MLTLVSSSLSLSPPAGPGRVRVKGVEEEREEGVDADEADVAVDRMLVSSSSSSSSSSSPEATPLNMLLSSYWGR
jgi:hypothetical protein